MFRLGDFYELFFEDAVTAARELEITLTARNKEKGTAIPMCGVPYHAAEGYIARLIGRGYRVAICDQMEEAGPGKKLVRREVTRIVTPGTATDAHLLRSHENNYLAAVARNGARAGLAYVDVSTGEFRATELDLAELPGLLESIGAREVLVAAEAPALPAAGTQTLDRHRTRRLGLQLRLRRPHPARTLPSALARWLRTRRHAPPPSPPPAPSSTICATRSAPRSTISIRPRYFDRAETMVLDAVTVRNLELARADLLRAAAPR